MKTTRTNTKRNTIAGLIVFFVFMLTSFTANAQDNQNTLTVTNNISATASTETTVASASSEFVMWFVGTTKKSSEKSNITSFSKKQLINSGVKTNNVLIKNVLKKVIAQENSIA